jgi:hypothetical protein
MGTLSHFVKHGSDLLPFRIELFELGHVDVDGIDRVI